MNRIPQPFDGAGNVKRSFRLPSLHRADALLLALVATHVLLKIALAAIMVHARPSGDEWAYMDAAKALSNAVRDLLQLTTPDTVELQTNVVGNGWFMPGMPVLAMPLYLVAPDAGIVALRLYLGLVTFALWLWAALALRRHLGPWCACAFLVVPSLIPLWVMFSFTLWGDLSAGLVLLVLLVQALSMLRGYRAGIVPSRRQACRLGVLAAVALYLRSSTAPLLPLLFAALLVSAWLFLPKPSRPKAIINLVAAGSVLLALVLPWSLAASFTLRTPVPTTTSVPLSLGITFGDTNKLCYGRCPSGEIWLTAVRYSREIALATGGNATDVQKAMARNALQVLTPQRYASRVVDNFKRYLLHPNAFVRRFVPASEMRGAGAAIAKATGGLYALLLTAFVAGLLVVFRRSFTAQATSVLFKLFGLALMLQPFVHVSHGRYWPVFAPFAGLALGLLLRSRANEYVTAAPTLLEPSQWLVGAQVLLAVGTITITLGLFAFAYA